MKLNHLNLTVSNVPETCHFLEKHFAFKRFGGREPNEAIGFLSDDNGMVFALFRAAIGTELKYPPGFHVGFIQESEERVNEINERLRADGYHVAKPAHLHGSWTFYLSRPEDSPSKSSAELVHFVTTCQCTDPETALAGGQPWVRRCKQCRDCWDDFVRSFGDRPLRDKSPSEGRFG